MKRYLLVLLVFLFGSAMAEDPTPLPEANQSTIGYASIEAALAALRADPAVVERDQQGWLIFDDRPHYTLWSFSPQGHPAYPSVVKREIVRKDGSLYVAMNVKCEASKSACDQLVRDFQQLNEQMIRAVQANGAK